MCYRQVIVALVITVPEVRTLPVLVTCSAGKDTTVHWVLPNRTCATMAHINTVKEGALVTSALRGITAMLHQVGSSNIVRLFQHFIKTHPTPDLSRRDHLDTVSQK
jgi:hypothetical protein